MRYGNKIACAGRNRLAVGYCFFENATTACAVKALGNLKHRRRQ